MAFGPDVVAALDRLANYYNGGGYDPQNNPGGMANGGHRLRFVPSLEDVALVVNAIGDLKADINGATDAAKSLTEILGRAALLISARFSGVDGNLTEGQTAFTVPGGYTPGVVMVFRNGTILQTADYTATNGSSVALKTAARSDDVFDVRGFRLSGLVDAAPAQHQHSTDDILGLGTFVRTMRTVDVASAATVDLGATSAGSVTIIGTTAISSFGTAPNQIRFLRFAGGLTLVNGANLSLPTGADIMTAPGDAAVAISNAAGVWTLRHYARANGYPLVTPLVFSGNSGPADFPAGTTRYFTHALVGTSQSQVYTPAGRRIRFSNLRVIGPQAPGANQTWKFTLQKLFSDTALTCTISGSGSNQATDATNSVIFEPGDRWSLRADMSAGAASLSSVLFSMDVEVLG